MTDLLSIHNNNSYTSKLSTDNDSDYDNDSDSDILTKAVGMCQAIDIFDIALPGDGDRSTESYRSNAVRAAKAAIRKAKEKGYAFWEVFKATYTNRVKHNGWTGEIFHNSVSVAPEVLLDKLETILEMTSKLNKEQFDRKFGVWIGKGYNPVLQELEELVKPKYERVQNVVYGQVTGFRGEVINERGVIDVTYEDKYTPFTPLADWDNLATILFGTTDILSQKMVEKWLISAVARAANPGCQADTCLVLKGNQGTGKSTFFRVIGGTYFSDLDSSTNGLEVKRQLAGSWILEMGEMEGITRKKDVEEMKAFLTKIKDTYRGLYEPKPRSHPRHVVFGGTCNSDEILKDTTGNRRFWVIDCGARRVNLEYLKANREAILGTAYSKYLDGHTWHADEVMSQASEERNMQYQETNVFQDLVTGIISELERTNIAPVEGGNDGVAIKLSELLEYGAGIQIANQKANQSDKKVAQVLTELGYIKRKLSVSGTRQMYWVMPDATNPRPITGTSIEMAKNNYQTRKPEQVQFDD